MTDRNEMADEKMPDEHYRSIARLEDRYWWHQARFRLAHEVITASGRSLPELRVADVGCGSGGFLRFLAGLGCSRLVGFDASVSALEVVARSGIETHHLGPDQPGALIGGPFDLITALDVLEHLADETVLLRSMRETLSPDGIVFVTVPAHQMLFSDWDRRLNHYRRYSRATLDSLLARCGLRILRSSHFFSFVVPMALLRRAFGWFDGAECCEFPAIPPALDRTLSRLAAAERRALRMSTLPIGTSLYALAVRA